MAQQTQQPLATTDGNRQAADPFSPLNDENSKPAPSFAHESEQHRTLHSKLMHQEHCGKQAGSYVSPSDDILSPASAKLNAFKEKRFSKSVKPRTLFAKTTSVSSGDLTAPLRDTQKDEAAK